MIFREFYDRAVDWAQVSLERASTAEERTYMRKILGTMVKHHDKVLDQRGSSGNRDGGGSELAIWRTYTVPFDEKLRKKKKYKKKRRAKDDFVPELTKKHTSAQTWEHFNRLCVGEKLMPADKEKLLKCQHLHHNDNYLRLGPFKLDIQHDAPFVGVFRNILHDAELEHFKDFARDKLYRSQVLYKKTTVVTRTSKQAWLEDALINQTIPGQPYTRHRRDLNIVDEVAARISDRISLAARLHTLISSGSEPYQASRESCLSHEDSERDF